MACSPPSWARHRNQKRENPTTCQRKRKTPHHLRDGRSLCGNCRGRFHKRPRGTPRSKPIEDDSATGGSRPVAGAAPVPKSGTPRSKLGTINPARRFRRASRIVTHRHSARRRVQIARRSRGVFPRTALSLATVAKALLKPGSSVLQSGLNTPASEVPATQQPPPSVSINGTNTTDVRQSGGNDNPS